MQSFFAPGKVMLSGEYAVLMGLEAFTVPTKQGQWLDTFIFDTPDKAEDKLIYKSLDIHGKEWISGVYDIATQSWLELSEEATYLEKIFTWVPSSFWEKGKSYRLETRLEFDRKDGLGSSSTFLSLICKFFRLDPFVIQQEVFGGSGYDVAIAEVGKSLRYWLKNDAPNFRSWELSEELTRDWYIVFWGEKVDSRKSSQKVKEKLAEVWINDLYRSQLEHVSGIIGEAQNTMVLEMGLEMYQTLLSQFLDIQRPYESLNMRAIPRGLCKWLGAWGGDMLLINQIFMEEYKELFNGKKVVPWNEVISIK